MKTKTFADKVRDVVRKIPSGKTLSYTEVARRAGSPKAARAVGQALSKNPFAPIIPCHRVIRKDGKPGGYSGPGGVKIKIELCVIVTH